MVTMVKLFSIAQRRQHKIADDGVCGLVAGGSLKKRENAHAKTLT
jgi:hypothetical protein